MKDSLPLLRILVQWMQVRWHLQAMKSRIMMISVSLPGVMTVRWDMVLMHLIMAWDSVCRIRSLNGY